MDRLQEVGGGDVGHVERRVLAQQHHVETGEVARFPRAEVRMRAGLALHRHGPAAGADPPVLQRQLVGGVDPERMAARLGLLHHQEGGVGLDVHRFQRVHLHGDLQRHGGLPAATWVT
jgi:hypothetical protein